MGWWPLVIPGAALALLAASWSRVSSAHEGRTALRASLMGAVAGALLGAPLGAALSYAAIEKHDAAAARRNRDWLASAVKVEAELAQDALYEIVTGRDWTESKTGTRLPHAAVAAEAIRSGLFADGSIDPDLSFVLEAQVEAVAAAREKLLFYRDLVLARAGSGRQGHPHLSEAELHALRFGCAIALGHTELLLDELAKYERARDMAPRRLSRDLGARTKAYIDAAHAREPAAGQPAGD